ncbi:DinB family protein [Deinococcus ruber]|uniref:DUF664 domain-containing protein n=1 Tax=Deinococcus ruber TaxID=1848197 RepID=A0A918C0M1_9DEIO|nr:DinB family protein [Deinococcus ruber]GGR00935.1 hypothetical protein GCM10008957_12260 [Deinococcus ruber]
MTDPQPADPSRWFRIEAQPEYTPHIGALVQMMSYARMTTLQAVEDIPDEELDSLPAGFSNSIGMLLAHIAALDRLYHLFSFRGVNPYAATEFTPFRGAMSFGKRGERVTGRTLKELLSELEHSRAVTLHELTQRDDTWLLGILTGWDDFHPNHYWAWFHVMEDELSHRGQIRVLRKALKRQREAAAE